MSCAKWSTQFSIDKHIDLRQRCPAYLVGHDGESAHQLWKHCAQWKLSSTLNFSSISACKTSQENVHNYSQATCVSNEEQYQKCFFFQICACRGKMDVLIIWSHLSHLLDFRHLKLCLFTNSHSSSTCPKKFSATKKRNGITDETTLSLHTFCQVGRLTVFVTLGPCDTLEMWKWDEKNWRLGRKDVFFYILLELVLVDHLKIMLMQTLQ